MERGFMGQPQMNPDIPLLEKPTGDTYIVAAQIRGKLRPKLRELKVCQV